MSKPVVVTIPHQLGRAEARRRIDAGLEQLTSQIGVVGAITRSWEGDVLSFTFQAIGQAISGTILVADQEARVKVLLPGIFAMIANKVKGRLRDEGTLLLGGPKTG